MDAGAEAWDRHLLDEDTFTENFRNDDWPSRTYLCYKVEGPDQGSGVPLGQDKGILHNKPAQGPEPSRHAECYLLEQIQSWNLDPKLHYGVTCFLSWSPCAKCAQKMTRFLQENSHVSLKLFASRLYTRERWDEDYKEGLRTLKRAGASIAIMTYREFEHCWKTFVLHDQEGSCFQPWPFLHKESQKFSEKLQAILQVGVLLLSLPPPLPSSPLSSPWPFPAPLRASTGLPAPSWGQLHPPHTPLLPLLLCPLPSPSLWLPDPFSVPSAPLSHCPPRATPPSPPGAGGLKHGLQSG